MGVWVSEFIILSLNFIIIYNRMSKCDQLIEKIKAAIDYSKVLEQEMGQLRLKKAELAKLENQLILKIDSNNELKKSFYQQLMVFMETENKKELEEVNWKKIHKLWIIFFFYKDKELLNSSIIFEQKSMKQDEIKNIKEAENEDEIFRLDNNGDEVSIDWIRKNYFF